VGAGRAAPARRRGLLCRCHGDEPTREYGRPVRLISDDRRGSHLPFRPVGETVRMRILVADDDPAVRESLRRSLAFNGYDVITASDGQEALQLIGTDRPDAVVLDVMMPRLDGLQACRTLRSTGDDLPVLMLTAREGVADRVAGLDAGADDYLPKPFALEELLARLRALLRRTAHVPGAPEDERLIFEDLVLDPVTRDVTRGNRPLRLTRTEYSLLEMFLHHPKRVLTRAFILEEVWGFDFPTTANSLEVYVGYLRRKTEEDGEPRLIHTVRGVGYVLRETPPWAPAPTDEPAGTTGAAGGPRGRLRGGPGGGGRLRDRGDPAAGPARPRAAEPRGGGGQLAVGQSRPAGQRPGVGTRRG
jgi:two-component system, OmpR family, response regulator MprA